MTLISGPDHRRDAAGMTYVYAVVSRRAGGVSVGINLNPNNACNWRCVYCQVPDLHRGAPPNVDLALLERELRSELCGILRGMADERPRHVEDVAFSGNGESTLSPQFSAAVDLVRTVLREVDPSSSIRLRLITNGSRVMHEEVERGIRAIGDAGGEVWFKVDAGSRQAIARINDVELSPESVVLRLQRCAEWAPTWVQTCAFGMDGVKPDAQWLADYLALLGAVGVKRVQGVLLYGIARDSMQPEASRLARLSAAELGAIADAIKQHGLTVRVSP